MQTPSDEVLSPKSNVQSRDWAARSEKPKRSVFGNYVAREATAARPSSGAATDGGEGRREAAVAGLQAEAAAPEDGRSPVSKGARRAAGLQAAIDTAIARSFHYQFLARAYEDPEIKTWTWLTSTNTQTAFQSAVEVLAGTTAGLEKTAKSLRTSLQPERFETFQTAYVTAFGHAARGDCPLNEIEYGDLKADPLFQPHRLADLAAFYRAFGLEVADGAAERPDHLGMELEFMSVLTAKEAYALEHQLDEEHCALCRDAQKKFLREHLGRWVPAFARRLARIATDEALAVLAVFTGDFIAEECPRFGVAPGNEDLLLRSVDEAAESLCGACGLKNLPPGADGGNVT